MSNIGTKIRFIIFDGQKFSEEGTETLPSPNQVYLCRLDYSPTFDFHTIESHVHEKEDDLKPAILQHKNIGA